MYLVSAAPHVNSQGVRVGGGLGLMSADRAWDTPLAELNVLLAAPTIKQRPRKGGGRVLPGWLALAVAEAKARPGESINAGRDRR